MPSSRVGRSRSRTARSPRTGSSSSRTSASRRASPEAALTAARAGDHERTLALLLALWADQPTPVLAQLIAAASALTPPTAAGLRGKTLAARMAWTLLAEAPPPRDIPALLEGLTEVSSGDAVARLVQLATWPADPRVDEALVRIVETVPYRATSTRGFWSALWPLVARITDPALIQRLHACDASIAANVAVTMGTQLRNALRRVLAKLTPAEAVAPAPPLVELARVLEVGRAATSPDELAHLLQAVYDHPDDDGARLVYADALLERGDPRGELIALQCRRTPLDRAQKQREKALLEAHGASWLGELAPVLMAGYRFERGFLAACRVDNDKRDHVRAVVGHPMWSTVRELRGSAAIALHPVMRSLHVLRFDPMNATHREGLVEPWRELLVNTERPLEVLHYEGLMNRREYLDDTRRWQRTIDDEEVAALMRCATLPRLRELVIEQNPALFLVRFLTAPVTKRLERLGIAYMPSDIEAGGPQPELLQHAFALAPTPVMTLDLRPAWHTTSVRLERGATGYERATVTLGPTSAHSGWGQAAANEAEMLCRIFPRTIRALHVTLRKHLEPAARARVEAAARALPGVDVVIA